MSLYIKILYLEHSAENVERAAELLRKAGLDCEWHMAGNKPGFMEVMHAYRPDIVITDSSMADLSIDEALEICRQQEPPTPLIVLTTEISENEASRILQLGAYDYVGKDRMYTLPKAVRNAVETAHAKRESDKLKRQENIYKKLLEKSGDMTVLVNEEGIVTYGSPSITTILEYLPDEYLGKNVNDWVYPEDLERYESLVQILISHPEDPVNVQQRLRHKDGHYVWCEGTITNYYSDPDIRARVSNFRDITERKEHELKIAESEKRYRDLFDENPWPMMIMEDGTFRFKYVNKAAVSTYGYSAEEFATMAAYDIKPKEDHSAMVNMTTINRSKLFNKGVWPHIRKDGSIIFVEVYANTIQFQGVKSHLILMNDITEKVRAEEALKKSEANLRTIFDNTATAFILTDRQFNIVSCNSVAVKWAYDAAHVELKAGVNLLETISVHRPPVAMHVLDKILGGETVSYESQFKALDGSEFYFHARFAPTFNDTGEVLGIVFSVDDITERKLAEMKIMQSEAHLLASQRIGNTGSWELAFEWGTEMMVTPLNISDQTCRIFGYEPGEIEPTSDFFVRSMHREDLLDIYDAMMDAIKNRTIFKAEHRIIKKDGSECIVRSRAQITYDPITDLAVKMTGTMQDVTRQIKYEEALKKSEANLRAIFENSDTGYLLLDDNLNIISFNHIINDLAISVVGHNLQEGMHLTSIVPAELVGPLRVNAVKVFNGENPRIETSFILKDGSTAWFQIKYSQISTGEGDNYGIMMSINDVTESKQAEQRLSQSQAHLLSSQRIGNVGSWELNIGVPGDISTVSFFWSAQTYRIFGFEDNEATITNDFLMNAIHPDDFPNIRSGFLRAYATDHSYTCELRIIRMDGTIKTVQSIAEIIRDPSTQEVLKIIGTLHDITERKRSEMALKKSEANIRTILENTDTSFVLIDNAFKVVAFNALAKKAFWRELGADLKEGGNTVDYFEGERKNKLVNNYQKVLNGEEMTYESEFTDEEGNQYWYFNTLSPLKDLDNNIQGMIMGRTDITQTKTSALEREKITAQLAKSEANLRTIFENTSISFLLLDPALKIVSFNKLANRGFLTDVGIQLEEGRSMLDYFPEDRREEAANLFRRTFEGEFIDYETDYAGLEEVQTWYHFQLSPIYDGDEKIFGILIAISNITERKIVEVERDNLISDIVQRNKDLEQFGYIVSHNLRGSVANIMGTSAILEEENLSQEEKKFVMSGLKISVNKLENVISDLNGILQVKQLLNERKEMVLLSDLIADIQTTVEQSMLNTQIRVVTYFSEVDAVLTIKSYLHSIFYNLITNSIKYRKPDVQPVIEISAHSVANGIKIVYKDNGLGLDLKKVGDQVFGLYKRFHANTEGKGMGLFMIKTQVESMGGKITIASEPGMGCEFTINFKV